MATVKVEIDGRTVEVEEGQNVIQAAKKLGIFIPHFCYHEGLRVDGNCRMCMIELEGGPPKPQIACNTFVKDGLKVKTDTPRIRELRKSVLEFLFLHHPLDCSICDQSGECYLQDYYLAHGNYNSRMDLPRDHKRKHIDAGKHIMLDAERCVLCTRCIRFCDDVTGTGELRIVNRGHRSEITLFPGSTIDNAYSLNTAEICPVGALTSKDFRFQWRVWFQKTAESICTGCSRGCNVFMDHADGRVYRYRARFNADVNGHWLCDDGRMTYKRLNEDRVYHVEGPVQDENDDLLLIDEAVTALAGVISGAGSVTALVSPDLANEDVFAAKRFATEVAGAGVVVAGSRKPEGVEDEILRKADLHPNTRGCRELGIWGDLGAAVTKGDLLLVFGEEILRHDDALLETALRGYGTKIVFARNAGGAVKDADWVVPIATHAEMDGSFTNFEGRVQRFGRAFPPTADAAPLWRTLSRIAAAGGKDWGWTSLTALRRDLVDEVPAWKDEMLRPARRIAAGPAAPGTPGSLGVPGNEATLPGGKVLTPDDPDKPGMLEGGREPKEKD